MKNQLIYKIAISGMTDEGITYKAEAIPHLTDKTKFELSKLANKIVSLEEVHSKITPSNILKGTPILEISYRDSSLHFTCEHDIVENLFSKEIGTLCDMVMKDMIAGMKNSVLNAKMN